MCVSMKLSRFPGRLCQTHRSVPLGSRFRFPVSALSLSLSGNCSCLGIQESKSAPNHGCCRGLAEVNSAQKQYEIANTSVINSGIRSGTENIAI